MPTTTPTTTPATGTPSTAPAFGYGNSHIPTRLWMAIPGTPDTTPPDGGFSPLTEEATGKEWTHKPGHPSFVHWRKFRGNTQEHAFSVPGRKPGSPQGELDGCLAAAELVAWVRAVPNSGSRHARSVISDALTDAANEWRKDWGATSGLSRADSAGEFLDHMARLIEWAALYFRTDDYFTRQVNSCAEQVREYREWAEVRRQKAIAQAKATRAAKRAARHAAALGAALTGEGVRHEHG